jgi:hypothetical protein
MSVGLIGKFSGQTMIAGQNKNKPHGGHFSASRMEAFSVLFSREPDQLSRLAGIE